MPLLIAALIAVVLITFLWAAYRTVTTTLIRAGGARAQAAAEQVATLLDARATIDLLRQLSADPDLRRYLLDRSDASRDRAQKRLTSLAAPGPRRAELWDNAGGRLLEVSVPGPERRDGSATALPPGPAPTAVGIGALQASGGMVFTDTVAEIREERSSSGDRATPARLGYLVVRSTFSVSPPGIIGRLVGRDALVKVGNRTGGVWSDFDGLTSAPGIDLTRDGIGRYRTENGAMQLGALATIPGSPWVAWVEFPVSRIVAPTRGFLEEMLLIAVVFVAIGAVLAGTLTARLTRSLGELSGAADAMAGGDYSGRVSVDRRDEIGHLGKAFNLMAAQIEDAQRRLEARVMERTTELAAARQEADRANRAKSDFLSHMSHDLRTPLNAILGFAQLLEIENVNRDQTEYVHQILTGGRHLLDLISEVLDVTRIESGQLSLSPEPVSVRDVVQQVVELVKPLAAQRRIAMIIESVHIDDVVRADRQRLSQILLNLLSNAVKYNRPDGSVTVSGERLPSDRYRITVADTGAGIPESKMQLLFRPFERLGAEQTAVEGTGLGLALSRALAEAMAGTLGMHSVVDHGSTFWVELPVDQHREREPATIPMAAPAHMEPTRGGLILYIEDNLANVRLMERILRQRPGVELRHAPTAETGFALIRERRPDLILLDLHLPDMSGEEALRHLWSDPASRSIAVVMVTADATPGLARRLTAAGATACVTKPLNVREVLRLIDDLLNRQPEVGGNA